MCNTPVLIKNKKFLFDTRYDRMYNICPCGKCSACLEQKRLSYNIRAYYEYQECKAHGGFTLYVTFTYNENNVPTFEVNGETIRCFSKQHVQTFLESLRKRLQRKYEVDLRYLWCSEYGGKTHRPHYHALLFISGKASQPKVRKWINELWKYGYIKFGDNYGVVNRPEGIQYCCKYVTKDSDFFEEHDTILKELMQFDDFAEYRRQFFPFHLQSIGLGISLLRQLTPEQIMEGRIPFPTKDGVKMFSLPLYYSRKLFYTFDKHGSYTLTAFGAQVMHYRLNKTNKAYIDNLNKVVASIDNIATQDLSDFVFRMLGTRLYPEDIVFSMSKFRSDFTDKEILDYKNNFRYFTSVQKKFPSDTYFGLPKEIQERYYRYIDNPLDVGDNYIYMDFSNIRHVDMSPQERKHLEEYMFNHYTDIEPYFQLYDTIQSYIGHQVSSTWFTKETKFKQYKNLYIE